MRSGLAGLSLAGLAAVAPTPQPGLTIVARESSPAAGMTETTTYVQDDRSREEWRHIGERAPGGGTSRTGDEVVAHITRCDLRKAIVLSYADRSYMSTRLGMAPLQAFRAFRTPPAQPPNDDAPQLLIEIQTDRTGESKEAFGYIARRVITTERHIPLDPGARAAREVVTDGWYIDLETRPSCMRPDPAVFGAHLVAVVSPGSDEPAFPRLTFRHVGAPERGYPIELRTTSGPSSPPAGAAPEVVRHVVVTTLVRGPLEPALFEVPPGFRHAGGPLAAFAERVSDAWTWMRALLTRQARTGR